MKIEFRFPEERNALVLDHRHGRREVTCKTAILGLYLKSLQPRKLVDNQIPDWRNHRVIIISIFPPVLNVEKKNDSKNITTI